MVQRAKSGAVCQMRLLMRVAQEERVFREMSCFTTSVSDVVLHVIRVCLPMHLAQEEGEAEGDHFSTRCVPYVVQRINVYPYACGAGGWGGRG